MTSKECINATLEGKKKEKLGHFDIFSDSILDKWQSEGLQKEVFPEEKFNLDIVLFGYNWGESEFLQKDEELEQVFPLPDISNLEGCHYNYPIKSKVYENAKLNEKYICVAFPGPFQHLCTLFGYKWVFENLILGKNLIKQLYQESINYNLEMLQLIYESEYRFDGVWIWEDIAYGKELFFSYSYYEEVLSEFHETLIKNILDLDKNVFFHSDGNIKKIIPELVDYGVEAVHPLENKIFDRKKIRKRFPELVCMGNVNYLTLLETNLNFLEELKLEERYIFGADSAISENMSLSNYKDLIKNKDLLWG